MYPIWDQQSPHLLRCCCCSQPQYCPNRPWLVGVAELSVLQSAVESHDECRECRLVRPAFQRRGRLQGRCLVRPLLPPLLQLLSPAIKLCVYHTPRKIATSILLFTYLNREQLSRSLQCHLGTVGSLQKVSVKLQKYQS